MVFVSQFGAAHLTCAPTRCIVVQSSEHGDGTPWRDSRQGTHRKGNRRTSISLPKEHYDILASLAEQNRVSVAWVVRDAVARYVEDRWPLLRA